MRYAPIFFTAFGAVFISSMIGCGSGTITFPVWNLLVYFQKNPDLLFRPAFHADMSCLLCILHPVFQDY